MLTQTAIKEIRKSKRCRNRLTLLFNKNSRTVDRYIESNHILLTADTAVTIIREETGLKKSEILELQTA